MVGRVLSATPLGFNGQLIEVEGDMSTGLPSLQIVGLGNKAIDEARDRVRSAIKNSLLDFPKGKIVINLAPAELPKDGAQFDLPIALAVLCLSGLLSQESLSGALFAGELALDGGIRPIKSSIILAETAKKHGIKTIYVPKANASQASLIAGLEIIPVTDLKSIFLHLLGESRLESFSPIDTPIRAARTGNILLDDIHGQEQAKRAAVIAVAGRHNLLLSGSPGSGKTMLAQALNGLLPPLTGQEIIEVTKIHNLGGDSLEDIVYNRPFRSPHHTASRISIVGGGAKAQPGEISLAHRGTLFLDELPEYPRTTLEALRQPLEDRTVSISRAQGKHQYPADFLLVATMNPCPCGYFGDKNKACSCTSVQILNYQKRLSGPLLDRIDLTINVSRVPHEQLTVSKTSSKEQHKRYVEQISNSLLSQRDRYNCSYKYNGNLSSKETAKFIPLSPEPQKLLLSAAKNLDLSARSFFKIIKVARTIADLDQDAAVGANHIAEALSYRHSVAT